MTSVRYFWSNDCISCRMPGDDLAGISCHLEKRIPDVFLTRTDSSKTYATSSWRALKNFMSSALLASPVRTHGALTKPASKCRSNSSQTGVAYEYGSYQPAAPAHDPGGTRVSLVHTQRPRSAQGPTADVRAPSGVKERGLRPGH
jgi:hypothetical protein